MVQFHSVLLVSCAFYYVHALITLAIPVYRITMAVVCTKGNSNGSIYMHLFVYPGVVLYHSVLLVSPDLKMLVLFY